MYKYLLYFLIFSFSGWCTEVLFQRAVHGRWVNRGLAHGPVCPIYGVGICLCHALLGGVRSFVLLALCSMAVATAVELAAGYLCERFLSRRLWDYTAERGNILGYVCPRYSLIWGIATATVIRMLPLLDGVIAALDRPVFKALAFTVFVLILMDERVQMIRGGRASVKRKTLS